MNVLREKEYHCCYREYNVASFYISMLTHGIKMKDSFLFDLILYHFLRFMQKPTVFLENKYYYDGELHQSKSRFLRFISGALY